MTVQLNHTIVWSTDQKQASSYLADMLGLRVSTFGHFDVVELDNDLSLDFAETDGDIAPQHYAFLVSEEEFDEIFGRITERSIDHWADPMLRQPDRINTHDGGRGVYFAAPDGHLMEIITRPYGSGADAGAG